MFRFPVFSAFWWEAQPLISWLKNQLGKFSVSTKLICMFGRSRFVFLTGFDEHFDRAFKHSADLLDVKKDAQDMIKWHGLGRRKAWLVVATTFFLQPIHISCLPTIIKKSASCLCLNQMSNWMYIKYILICNWWFITECQRIIGDC